MKRKMVSKVLAGALCASMMLSMTCSVSAETEQNGSADEPITLTWGQKVADCSWGDGVHSEESAALKKLEEETGVTIEFVTYDDEKFKMLASGGDLPDIVSLSGDDSTIKNLIDAGQIIALDDLLDQYGDNIKNNIPDALAQVKYSYGATYFMPVFVTDFSTEPIKNGFMNFMARYDIYKEIGSPEINTEDDFLNVLKQMQDYQREKTGENDIYALSAWSDSGSWPYIITYPFSYGYTNKGTTFSLKVDEAELQSNYMQEDSVFWKGLEFFNKAYRLGIFDPDGFTQKNAQYQEKVQNGKILCSGNGAQPNIEVCGENAINVRLPGTYFPYIDGVYNAPYPYGYGTSSARAISANCKDPERAMKLLNYFDSADAARTLSNGIKGEDWDVIDGVPQLIGEYKDSFKKSDGYTYRITKNADGVGGGFLCSHALKSEDGIGVYLSDTLTFFEENASVADKAFAQDFDSSASYPGQIYQKWINDGMVTTEHIGEGVKVGGFMPLLSDEAAQLDSEAANYFLSNVASLVTADSEESFADEKVSMIQKFKDMGYEKVVDEMMQGFESAKKAYAEANGK